MSVSKHHAAWLFVGMCWALLSGMPVVADDTELFFVDRDNIETQPNILFILDNSGSMEDLVESQGAYDPSFTYPAAASCGTGRVYYATRSGGRNPQPPAIPDCTTSTSWFNKSALVCKAALDDFADGAERFEDQIMQYNPSTSGTNPRKWLSLNASYPDRKVECRDDRNVHSDGTNPYLYIRDGNSSPWGSRSNEATWTNTETTLFDGNYLNWYYGPTGPEPKIDIMKAVMRNMLNTIEGVNVGMMNFNYDQGGFVSYAMEDIATARTAIRDAVDDVEIAQFTPLSETLYEAALYLRGGNLDYGDVGPIESVDAARTAAGGGTYKTPVEPGCQKNFIVYLTDGEPTSDTGADTKIEGLIGGECSGNCLDELAGWLNAAEDEDVVPSVDGDQSVTTYTIGFDIDFPLLLDTAQAGGGAYFTATNSASLTTALTAILYDILGESSTFTAPAVSVNSFNRTRNLNDLYISVFTATPTAHWPGNLKKYKLRPSDGMILDANDEPAVNMADGFFAEGSQSLWSAVVDGPDVTKGGAANKIPLPASRNVYTYLNGVSALTAAGNQVVSTNSVIDDTLLNTGGTGRPTRADIIDFIRGEDPSTNTPRYQMGDPLHAQPASVTYNEDLTIIYFATNDGYLHAIDADTGEELWAFVPPEFMSDQVDLFLNGPAEIRHYGIDGSPRLQIVADNDGTIESGEKVMLFFGMRRGGDFYYGLDVTNPAAPTVMWRLPGAGAQALPGNGQSWSNPTPTRINFTGGSQSASNLVLVFGAGYDPRHDDYNMSGTDSGGNGIYVVDSENGNVLWRGTKTGGTEDFSKMDYSIPADIRVIDLNADGYADRMYAADMGGQVWRFDITNNAAAADAIAGGVLAQLGGAPATTPAIEDTRRFYYAPDVALVNAETPFIHIGIGSGHRARPNSVFNNDRFYALRDYATFSKHTQAEYDAFTPITDDELDDVTTDVDAVVPADSPGWKIELGPGEKVLSEARTFNNEVFFTTFTPGAGAGGNTTNCRPALGTNRLYTVGIYNGSPVNNLDSSEDEDDLEVTDRYREFKGSISSEVVFIFPSPEDEECVGEECTPPPIACVDLFCFPPGFANNPVRTFWSQENVD